TELLQHSSEQHPVLETIAAAACADELVLQGGQVETHRPAEQRVEVLERNVRHVRTQQPGQRVISRARRTAPLDPLKIGVEIDRCRHIILPSVLSYAILSRAGLLGGSTGLQ